MRRLISATLTALASVLLAAACETPVCGCTPARYAVTFRGQVFSPDSVAVAGATVTPEAGIGSCDVPDESLEIHTSVSGQNGVHIGAGVGTFDEATFENMCLRVRALPPDSSEYAPSDYVPVTVDPNVMVVVDFYLTAPEP